MSTDELPPDPFTRESIALERYLAAQHAMQTGVAMEMALPERQAPTEPKHLRVGINTAMVDHYALVTLLEKKGLFTHEEYLEALADAMEEEKKRYEESLSRRTGVDNVHLA